jgi:hypothetical protein
MAEPLTSSDILRERMGFGVSPLAAPETRRAYAAAGLSPLGTQERERFERGSGISPMATASEKEAWKMAEYMAGEREQAPVEYGGLGERPTGTSRRAIRMQTEWDKQREIQLKEAEEARQKFESDRSFALQQQNQFMDSVRLGMQEAEFNVKRKLQDQMDYEVGGYMQGIDKLNPQSPDYSQGVMELNKRFPLATTDERINNILGTYNSVHEIYMKNRAGQQADQEAVRKELQNVAKISEESGVPTSNLVSTDPTTGNEVINYEALGRAEAQAAQKKAKPEQPLYGGKTQKELEAIISGINADIAEANAGGGAATVNVEGLEAKRAYYEGLLPKDNKDVANTAKSQYIPVEQREAGKVYPTPQGDLKWTGSGWIKP